MIIDTHLHLIDRTALTYPWLSSVPALDRDYLYETYRQEALRCGIAASLHMEVDVAAEEIEAETLHVGQLAALPESLLVGAIAACRPEDQSFPAMLERQRENPLVKGFRRVLHVMPDDLSESAVFRDNIKRLAGTGLTFDLCVLPRQLGHAAALADLAPDVTFILDHCGVPDIKAGDISLWRDELKDVARRPNVVCKISGLIAYTDPDSWSVDKIRPYAETAILQFGWDRVVWGSDWPVCTLAGSLSTWVAATHALLAGSSDSERHALLAGNALKLWSLDLPIGA
ncbi:amidohydrolase [Rhizobium sp. DKSPLA3]|uniref:Amidohydrolase n=1 Tax=Rhizobium quercicola TaxID=2901226 RepID=A0A9X1NQL9_9HYPH|nr:amidohydrolase [Rhizobium quercicola]MCD7107508.1 amidohydrolase [Rhizobium quercicola]